MNNSLFTISL
ncbi:hypothetical protein CGLO_14083 [Colletotrichum gloeosporioides Cg-14]|uniref:Uncharacterized protein n=1 Tax=Colletotrichum gloeosporioides (strain Cg-14) TaxID=1237896 RepID=T0K280_COLGC|nr:hypothetical protein CGLO_14083 [Colletotrichum gloeosporioides Cg-14]